MKDGIKIAGGIIAVLLSLMLLGWLIQGNNFFMYKIFAPEYENVRRETFENTQSYVDGKRQELLRYRMQYMKTKDDLEKKAIKNYIIQSFASFPEDKIQDAELRSFLHEMKFGL